MSFMSSYVFCLHAVPPENPLTQQTARGLDAPLLNLVDDKVGPLLATLRGNNHKEVTEVPGHTMLSSYVDSGSARSVCPRIFGAQFPVVTTGKSQRGEGFQTATGKRVQNLGGRKITGKTSTGENISMGYAVADVAVALDSVSQICDSGATVVFRKDGGYIQRPDGQRTEFRREHDTYVRDVWVPTTPPATATGATEPNTATRSSPQFFTRPTTS